MATRKGMIGHNPLAWLSGAEDKPKKSTGTKKVRVRTTGKKKAPKKKAAIKKTVAVKVVKPKAVSRKKVKTVPKKDLKSKDSNLKDTGPKESVIELSSMQAISQVSDLHRQLMEMLSSESDIAIDGSQVTSIDAASLQLIYALWKEADKSGKNISWQNPSGALCDAARLLGMESGLQLNKAA